MHRSVILYCGLLVTLIKSAATQQSLATSFLFQAFFPCTPHSHSIITQEDAQSCDLFLYAAVQLAIEQGAEGIWAKKLIAGDLTESEGSCVREVSNHYWTRHYKNKRACIFTVFLHSPECIYMTHTGFVNLTPSCTHTYLACCLLSAIIAQWLGGSVKDFS